MGLIKGFRVNLGFLVLGFWGFGVLGFWAFGLLGFWAFGVLGCWGVGVLGFWGFGFLGFWGFGVSGSMLDGSPGIAAPHSSARFGLMGPCTYVLSS